MQHVLSISNKHVMVTGSEVEVIKDLETGLLYVTKP